jgi:hypothetical protein
MFEPSDTKPTELRYWTLNEVARVRLCKRFVLLEGILPDAASAVDGNLAPKRVSIPNTQVVVPRR